MFQIHGQFGPGCPSATFSDWIEREEDAIREAEEMMSRWLAEGSKWVKLWVEDFHGRMVWRDQVMIGHEREYVISDRSEHG